MHDVNLCKFCVFNVHASQPLFKVQNHEDQDEVIVHATLTVGVKVSVNWLVYTTT